MRDFDKSGLGASREYLSQPVTNPASTTQQIGYAKGDEPVNNLEAKTGEIMPKEAIPTDENKRLRTLTRGWVTDDKLAILRDQFKCITVSTAKGYKECVKAIGVVRTYRTTLEKSRIEKNRKEQENISDRNKEAKRITAILLEIETPLKEMKQAKDERDAKEKAEKERVEKERIDAIKQRIEDNFGQHQIDYLAGKPSAYMQARIRIIEALEVDDTYQELMPEATRLRRELLERISNIYVAKRQQEEADKQLLAEKAKLDAQKQKMAAEAKRLEEQQKEFEKERAAWNARKAEEEAGKEAEAETGQAVEEDPAKEPAHEADQAGTGGAEAAEEAQGSQVTEPWPESGAESAEFPRIDFSKEEEEDILSDEPEDEEEIVPVMLEFYLDVSDSQANRIKIVELIRIETGIKDFDNNALTDLLALARMMYWDDKFSNTIRDLAVLARKELELYESIPE